MNSRLPSIVKTTSEGEGWPMYSAKRPATRLRRALLIAPMLLGLVGAATIVQTTSASAEPRTYCDYVAEQGIIGADSMVHHWWAVGHAHGCW